MSGLTDIVRAFCLSLPTRGNAETTDLLSGVSGRGEFGPRLVKWLELSSSVFSETVRIEYPESLQDRGVDVYLEGQSSQTAIGFQIKSDRDVQEDDFLQRLKAQITDARAYPKIELYVIVLACTPERFMRLQYVLTEELQHWQVGRPEILTLPPGRSAALWQRCDRPLTLSDRETLLRGRTWNSFFADAGAPTREGEFLQNWFQLSPAERFLPPKSLEKIQASLRENPLTVLAGPPTIGKTFSAVQLLWQHYRQGKPVEWIEPLGMGTASSIIPPSGPTFAMQEHTRQLAFRLGLRPPLPPQNRWEFIAARMQPDSLVLIEDPFGMTDADYDHSLHTYDFFDLEGCIEAICEGGRQADCRLLITTRHGLLDRWLAERRAGEDGRGIPKAMNIIHLTPEDYQPSTSKEEPPLVQFSKKLLRATGKAFNDDIESIAHLVGRRTQTPQEVQFVVGELSDTSKLDDVRKVLQRVSLEATERLRLYCHASADGERLFLFLLMTTLQGEDHNDFATVYAAFHRSLQLPGDPRSEDLRARTKYWPLFYQIVFPEGRDTFFNRGVHLKASHSAVGDAARREIAENGNGFLDRMLVIVSNGSLHLHDRKMVARHLVHEHRNLTDDSLNLLAAALPELIEPSYTLSFGSIIGAVMSEWEQLPDIIRTAFFNAVRDGVPRLAAEVCEMFMYYPLPEPDTWRFYDLLIAQKPLMGVGQMMAIRHPWEYFVRHLSKAPQSMVDFFDEIAKQDPSGFSFVMGKLASSYWSQFPPSWKEAISSDHSARRRWKPQTAALHQIFYGLFSYENEQPPAQILQRLRENLTSAKRDFRALAGTWTLIYWEHLSEEFHDQLRTLFRTEQEPGVLLEILHEGMSHEDDAHDLELASIVVERANDVMAACLLSVFMSKSRTGQKPMLMDLIEKCKIKGGQYSRAVLLEGIDANAVESEPDIVKLAYIWKIVTELSSSKKAKDGQLRGIVGLINELTGEHRQLAYYIVAYHEKELPETFQEFIKSLEKEEDKETRETVSEARTDDAEHRRPNGGRTLPGFPMFSFGPQLT